MIIVYMTNSRIAMGNLILLKRINQIKKFTNVKFLMNLEDGKALKEKRNSIIVFRKIVKKVIFIYMFMNDYYEMMMKMKIDFILYNVFII